VRILFDTNVLVSAFTTHGLCHQAYERALIQVQIVTAPRLLDELRRSLSVKMRIENKLADEICAELENELELVEPEPLLKPVCRDRDDDWVLAAALAGRVEIIVSGDKDLLALKEFRGVKILSPRQFIELISSRK